MQAIANPVGSREDSKVEDELVDKAATIQKDQSALFASFKSVNSVTEASYPYQDIDFWEPQLRKMRGFGMVHSEKFMWPSLNLLKQLDLTKVIKLCGIELGMTSNLIEIRLLFTDGMKSPLLRAEGAAQARLQGGN